MDDLFAALVGAAFNAPSKETSIRAETSDSRVCKRLITIIIGTDLNVEMCWTIAPPTAQQIIF
jgi:hypothetical protein